MNQIAPHIARDAIPVLMQRLHNAPIKRRETLAMLLLDTSLVACRNCIQKNCERCLAVQ